MSRALKVLVLMDTAEVSGPAKQLLDLAPRLAERGVTVHCVVFQSADGPRSPFARALLEEGISHTILTYAGRLDRALVTGLREIVETVGPHIVQTHSYRPTALTALIRPFRPRWRWVAFFHGATRENLRVRAYQLLENMLMRLADRVVVVSESQRRRFRGPAPQVTVLHNAILEGSKAELPSDLPDDSPGVLKLAVVARLSKEKGVDVFLRAAHLLKQHGDPFIAVVAGDGVERRRLEDLSQRLDLQETVRFLGYVTPVEGIYEWCDVVVVPSRSEGMPNVVLEAVRHGRRVVTTDVGNVRDIVGGSSLGDVVPPERPGELASAIRRAAKRVETEGRFPERERSAILDRFSLKRREEAHIELYEDVLRGA